MHSLLLVAVGAMSSYSDAEHKVAFKHCRSDVAVAFCVKYCVDVQFEIYLHRVSVVGVLAAL